MVLLNLGKKKEEAKKEAVPDELPSLPESKPAAQAGPQVVVPAPAIIQAAQVVSQQAVQPRQLAPDELPPIQHKEEEHVEKKPSLIKTSEKFYFSEIIAKFHNKELSIEDVERELLTEDAMHNMRRHWEEESHEKEKGVFQKKIEEKLTPLEKLEKEWRELKNEISQLAKSSSFCMRKRKS